VDGCESNVRTTTNALYQIIHTAKIPISVSGLDHIHCAFCWERSRLKTQTVGDAFHVEKNAIIFIIISSYSAVVIDEKPATWSLPVRRSLNKLIRNGYFWRLVFLVLQGMALNLCYNRRTHLVLQFWGSGMDDYQILCNFCPVSLLLMSITM
jgi:hypothetical protein